MDSSNSLSAISAINSPLVGFMEMYTLTPKTCPSFSDFPRVQATSMACLIARSTLLGEEFIIVATFGYSSFVIEEIIAGFSTASLIASLKYE